MIESLLAKEMSSSSRIPDPCDLNASAAGMAEMRGAMVAVALGLGFGFGFALASAFAAAKDFGRGPVYLYIGIIVQEVAFRGFA